MKASKLFNFYKEKTQSALIKTFIGSVTTAWLLGWF